MITVEQLKITLKTLGYTIKDVKVKTNIIVMVETEAERKPTLCQLLDICQKIQSNAEIVKDNLSSIGIVKLNNFKIAVKSIQKGNSKVHYELENIERLNKDLNNIMEKTGMDYVPLKIGNKIYKVTSCQKTPGTPKSDFHLLDTNGNECVWISHKAGKTVKDYQQWGGVSQKKEPKIYAHDEVKAFREDMLKKFPLGIPNKTTVARKLKDNVLKNMSVYGSDYTPTANFGRQNVTMIAQGDLSIIPQNNYYIINATGHISYNPEKQLKEAEPVIVLIYKGDRNDLGIKGARCVIMPINGRKITEFV